ncbi:hypothetical protein AMELA_G00135740 [Ameiurus melas]|uniref:Uncharacterized protein n=1 Tax=Ameiurus melas TaxID=219545 RepID=A0A7J6AJG5_AMEME|nr:hypothetical protein AMELA_G00135740 [Ameiurus melas]
MCLRMSSSPTHSLTDSGSALNYNRSRSCSTSIDNRIAQAMDLVKTHMLSAVREEVEPLREIIQNLTQRNRNLERENHLLRSITKYQKALKSVSMASAYLSDHKISSSEVLIIRTVGAFL